MLPYQSREQVTSGVLSEAVAAGPVVATAFPHAVELLSSGAGLVASRRPGRAGRCAAADPDRARLAGGMAAEARRLAPTMAWPVVAKVYLGLARRVVAERPALV